MEEITDKKDYKNVKEIFEKLESCLNLLKQEEDKLYKDIVDAVDTVTAKIKLVEIAQEKKIKIISSMGTGNKLDPTKLEVTDIYKTSICPLARVMRRELKKRKIPALKVVYSTEKPIETDAPVDPETHKKTPGSISFVPSCAGLIIASVVVRDLLHIK